MNQKNTTQNLKDVSHFTRWVNDLDAKDRSLTTRKRKRKWILITTGIFTLFVLSFLLFPSAKTNVVKVPAPYPDIENQNREPTVRTAFDLPVDSFETHLKIIIDENLSEKE